jgi:hypothetical protein
MSESNEFERAVALAWFMCHYTEKQAKLSAELQGLSWDNIQSEYGNLYAEQEAASNG